MADFICTIGTESGEVIQKRFSSESKETLELDLQGRGYYVFRIRPAAGSFWQFGRRAKIKIDDFIIFNQEFRVLLKAGLPAVRGLDILIERQGESELGSMIKQVREAVVTGASLSEAFAAHRNRLPTAYVSTLVAGESSGDLPGSLARFIELSKVTNNVRKQFRRALYYPIFLLLISAVLLGIMITHVLPEFAKFYEGLEETLPDFTLFVIGVSHAVRNTLPIWVPTLAVLIAATLWWRTTQRGKRTLTRLSFRLPLIGALLRKYNLSQAFHALSSMLKGGIPLLTALTDLAQSTANALVADALEITRRRISEGDTLSDSVDGTVFDEDLAVEMIQVGESTGALPDMLSDAADFYDDEIRNRLDALLSLIEPILLVLMAILIGALLFAMYYPLFNLLGRVGR